MEKINQQQKVKILYCIDTLIHGGTELQLTGLLEHLDHSQYKPYLLTIRPTDKSMIPENVIHLEWHVPKLLSLSGIKQLFHLVKFLRQERFLIVQTYFQDSTMFGGIAAWLARVPVRIACFRDLGFWQNPKQDRVLKQVYSLMTGYICNAKVIKQYFSQLFAIPDSKISVIRNGIDIKSVAVPEISDDVKNIVIVGNMTRQVKRMDLFVRAAGIVAKTYPEIQWHILGDGHLQAELKKMSQELDLTEKQVVFAGRRPDVKDYLNNMDIGVLCSDSEGLSNALLEYMLLGLPVVATEVGGNPELITHDKTGLLVPANDEDSLANAILGLIKDRKLRQTLAINGQLKILEEYSWQTSVESYETYYQVSLND